MRFGMCVGSDEAKIKLVAESGFDFVESCFSLLAESDDEKLNAFKNELDKYSLKCETVNCFLPGSLKVTGPNVDYDALREYIEKGVSRGKPIGLEKVVFGSSGARNVPDAWSYEEAYRQIAYFLKEIAAPIAEKYGVIITIEPLRKTDSNIVNSAFEGAALASQAASDSIKCLVDFYHMYEAGDDCETVRKLTGAIKHAHIAEPLSRHYPRKDDGADYKSFVAALESAGCETCSVEASTDDFERDCAPAFEALKQ